MPTTITRVEALDIRFPTSEGLHGSDAMNPDPDYSAAYVILHTDRADGLQGHHGSKVFQQFAGGQVVDADPELTFAGVARCIGGEHLARDRVRVTTALPHYGHVHAGRSRALDGARVGPIGDEQDDLPRPGRELVI